MADPIPTENLIHRATAEHLRTVLFALLATHPELDVQARSLLGQRPSPLNEAVTTTARLSAFQPGWLYRDRDGWFRIVEIEPLSDGRREVLLEPALSITTPMSTAAFSTAIVDSPEPFTVKIPRGRL